MKKYFILLSACTLAIGAHADNEKDKFNPIVTAVISQSISPDARSTGMGETGVANDPDVNSQYWNPAKYPFTISRAGVSINYTPWLRKIVSDIALINATGYVRIGDYQAISGSINYFTLGDVTTKDNNLTVRPYEMSVDVAYSRMLSDNFSAAVALRYMYSDISGHYDNNVTAGSAFAADLGLYWNKYIMLGQRESMLSFGLNLKNIGSKINYGGDYSYFIPTKMQLGSSLLMPLNEYNKLGFSLELSKLLVPSQPLKGDDETSEDYQERIREQYYDISSIKGIFKSFGDSEEGFKGELKEINVGLGMEYTYNDKFSLRGGYYYQSTAMGGSPYFTFGAGFRMNVLAIDASYIMASQPSYALDQTFRIGLTFDMDGIRDLFGKRKR